MRWHHDVTLRPAIEQEMLCSGSALARHLDTVISLLGTAGRAGPRRCGGQDPGARLCTGRSESDSLPLEESLAREDHDAIQNPFQAES